jgi:hypothetical protein
MGVLGVVDVVSLSSSGSSREVLEYSGLPTGASRLRAGLPRPTCFVLDRDHQVVFFCLIARAFKKHPDGLVGTFGDEDRVARFNVDRLPRLVQIQAEGFLHNEPFHWLTRGYIGVICGFKARC